ncbi:MAG: hypothetical protein P8L39_07785 [Halioglobus sp.]|nr:hypothetical protein [Halioglobus sp.]
MNINTIADIILDETSSPKELRDAVDAFALLCSQITSIRPDPSFDAWAHDSFLENGVAINPQAAALCALDYQRSVVFIRGIYAAIKTLRLRFPGTRLEILYAGCGPFATLLLPLLDRVSPGDIELSLLDFHQQSLDSVSLLLTHFGLRNHAVKFIKADACKYNHARKLHLIIVEAMQKSLEQEPQFAITANLAPQLIPAGIFIPERIDVSLYLADLEHEQKLINQSEISGANELKKNARRYLLARVCNLNPAQASGDMRRTQTHSVAIGPELAPIIVTIPRAAKFAQSDAALFTRIRVFEQYGLKDYESQITLPLKCYDLVPLTGGDRYEVSYQLGRYPRFNFRRLKNE